MVRALDGVAAVEMHVHLLRVVVVYRGVVSYAVVRGRLTRVPVEVTVVVKSVEMVVVPVEVTVVKTVVVVVTAFVVVGPGPGRRALARTGGAGSRRAGAVADVHVRQRFGRVLQRGRR